VTSYVLAPVFRTRRPLVVALVTGLCVAALSGIVAIALEGFGEAALKVIALGWGVAVFSATGAAGAALLQRGWESVHPLGYATVGLSVLSFVVLDFTLFVEAADGQLLACLVLATFAASHASLVTLGANESDGVAVLALCWTSIAGALILAGTGIALVLGAWGDAGEGLWKAIGSVVIVTSLASVLPPVLRRL